MSMITINAEERAEILGALWQWTDGETHQFKTRAEAVETLDKLQHAFALMDELGWDEDTADTQFTVTVTTRFVDLLRRNRRESLEAIKAQRESREKAKTDRDYWPGSAEITTTEAALSAHDKCIRAYEREAEVFGDLLARIDEQMVTA